MGGGGSRTIKYEQPEPDRSFEKYLEYEMRKDRQAEDRRKADEEAAKTKAAERKAGARTNAGAFYNNLESQLRGGLISFADATSQLQGYGARAHRHCPGRREGSLATDPRVFSEYTLRASPLPAK